MWEKRDVWQGEAGEVPQHKGTLLCFEVMSFCDCTKEKVEAFMHSQMTSAPYSSHGAGLTCFSKALKAFQNLPAW